jgi:hypothetical protein
MKWTAASFNITASLIQSTAILTIQWIAWILLIHIRIFMGSRRFKRKRLR